MLVKITPNLSKNFLGDISFQINNYEEQTYVVRSYDNPDNYSTKLKDIVHVNSWRQLNISSNRLLMFEDSLYKYEFIDIESPYLVYSIKKPQ
jgi:hypothetical protein